MTLLAAIPPTTLRLILLGASAFMLYGAGRLVMGAVPARADRPTVRALLGTAIVLAVTLVAIVMGRPGVGLHLPIAAATAAMTFGIGSLVLGRAHASGRAGGNPSWTLLAPAVAITLLAGLGGAMDLLPIVALLAFGVVAVIAWREPAELRAGASPPRMASGDDRVEDSPALMVVETPDMGKGRPTPLAVFLWIGGIALSALAGVLVMLGLPALETAGVPSDALAVAFLLSPAIVVPIFFELLPPAKTLSWDGSVSVLVKFALMNLCFSLPIAALVQADAGVIRGLIQSRSLASVLPASQPASQPTTQAMTPATEAVDASTKAASRLEFPNIPPAPMRADLLVLLGAMLLIIPIAGGWQKPGGMEAAALIACYLLSLSLVMASAIWRR